MTEPKRFRHLDDDEREAVRVELDNTLERIWQISTTSSQFVQRTFVLANAGGVVASVGFLGTSGGGTLQFFAGLTACTIFFVGMCLCISSTGIHSSALQEYLNESENYKSRILQSEIFLHEEGPEIDRNKQQKSGNVGKIGAYCFYGGGAISIVMLWVYFGGLL